MRKYYEQDGIVIFHGDALEVLPNLTEGSVALVATDPPYFRVKDTWWDRQWKNGSDFLNWVDDVVAQVRRVCAQNASLYWFASPDMEINVTSRIEKRFRVLNRIRWMKDAGWHHKADQDRLRSYLSPWESIVFAEVPPAGAVRYLADECQRLRITPEQLSALLGFKPTPGSIGPRRYLSEDGFAPMSRASYLTLQNITGGFARPYDSVYRYFMKPTERDLWDVWNFAPVQATEKHECEKPLSLMEYIVLASSPFGSTVLDCFMGSGTTLLAAKTVGRKAIGIDIDEAHCEVAANRLSQGLLPLDIDGDEAA